MESCWVDWGHGLLVHGGWLLEHLRLLHEWLGLSTLGIALQVNIKVIKFLKKCLFSLVIMVARWLLLRLIWELSVLT